MFEITIQGDDQGGVQMTYNGQPVPVKTADEAMQVLTEVLSQGADPESAAEDQGEPVEAGSPDQETAQDMGTEPNGEPPPEEDDPEAFAKGFKSVRGSGLNGRG